MPGQKKSNAAKKILFSIICMNFKFIAIGRFLIGQNIVITQPFGSICAESLN